MPKRILFVTSVNLTSNPRLLKVLKYAIERGHKVEFLGFKLGNWSDEIDKQIAYNLDAKLMYLSAMRKPFIKWLLSDIYARFFKAIFTIFPHNTRIAALTDKRSVLLDNFLKNHAQKYDIIISHTLQSLYPAYKFAQKINTQFTFDIEDYHVGESCSDKEKSIRTLLMRQILPKAIAVSYASPLIGKYSLELCSNKIINHQLINNCFSKNEFQFTENNSKKVKFVWFSQNIAQGRGLEQIVPIIHKFKNKAELHLIGNLYTEFYEKLLSEYEDCFFIHAPLPQKSLNSKMSEFDIGLAIETGKDLNNSILLSNKIWTYMQSGLYILATKTPAQIQFLQKHCKCGILTDNREDSLSETIEHIISSINEIRKHKFTRYEYAQRYAWENERHKLDKLI